MRANALAACVVMALLVVAVGYGVSCAGGVRPTGRGEWETVRIMPCGDSITYDNHVDDTRPAGLRIGYRQPLWHMLKDAGFAVEFVGSVVAGQDAIPAFDPHSEGHPGWRDDEIADNIYGWLTATPADIVLLHIGTNGLDTSATDVADILDEIDRYEADGGVEVTVLLARIIRGNHVCPNSSITTSFNDNVEAMALARISGGDSIVLVDLECGVGMDYREMPDGDMYDSLHPTDNGYWKMAGGWFAHLKDILTPEDAPAGLMHYWKLEDAGGPPYVNAMDGSDATCSGCPTYTYNGLAWGCLEFDGEDDEVQVPDDGSFDWGVDASFTIEFWMRKDTACDGGTVNDNEVIVGRDDPGTDLHWWVGVDCGQSPGGVACFQLLDTGHGGEGINGTTVLTDGEWHHVVAVRNALVDSTFLYVDGIREASAGYDYANGFGGVTPLDIGFLTLSEHYRYEGLIDEIALYERALSESEIFAHHVAGLEGKGYAQSSDGSLCFTSNPITEARVGQMYAYDAEVGGAVACFSLGAHPAAMQIESASGLVTWLPEVFDLGLHPVEVILVDTAVEATSWSRVKALFL